MIEVREEHDVRIVTLAHGKANALDAKFLREIAAAFAADGDDLPRGVVLRAEGTIFSAGLDLPALVAADRDGVVDLVDALVTALRAVFAYPRPVVCALGGHAIAGGALLALAADRRVMAAGPARIGLTEIQLGLSLPASAIEMLRYPLSRSALESMVFSGKLFGADEAHAIGAVDEVVAVESLLDECIHRVQEWTSSVSAFADIKARLRGPTLERMDRARAVDHGFVDQWFDADVRARLVAAVEEMRARRGVK